MRDQVDPYQARDSDVDNRSSQGTHVGGTMKPVRCSGNIRHAKRKRETLGVGRENTDEREDNKTRAKSGGIKLRRWATVGLMITLAVSSVPTQGNTAAIAENLIAPSILLDEAAHARHRSSSLIAGANQKPSLRAGGGQAATQASMRVGTQDGAESQGDAAIQTPTDGSLDGREAEAKTDGSQTESAFAEVSREEQNHVGLAEESPLADSPESTGDEAAQNGAATAGSAPNGEASSAMLYLGQDVTHIVTITFDANGGEGEMPAVVWELNNEEHTLPKNTFTSEGYVFSGWSPLCNGSEADAESGAVVVRDEQRMTNLGYTLFDENGNRIGDFDLNRFAQSGNLTLYAQWQPIANEAPYAEFDSAEHADGESEAAENGGTENGGTENAGALDEQKHGENVEGPLTGEEFAGEREAELDAANKNTTRDGSADGNPAEKSVAEGNARDEDGPDKNLTGDTVTGDTVTGESAAGKQLTGKGLVSEDSADKNVAGSTHGASEATENDFAKHDSGKGEPSSEDSLDADDAVSNADADVAPSEAVAGMPSLLDLSAPAQEPTSRSAIAPVSNPFGALPSIPTQPLANDPTNQLLGEDELMEATRLLVHEYAKGPEATGPKTDAKANGDNGAHLTSATLDGTTIEYLRMHWVTPSSGEVVPAGANRLRLAPEADDVPAHQFQFDFSLSGKDRYEPGAIEMVIPAAIWQDRDGNATMQLTANGISAPEEFAPGASRADFVWRQVDDRIVITNNKTLPAATAVMVQGHFEGAHAHDMRDLTTSDALTVTVTIATAAGHELSATSNAIDALIDTYHNVPTAHKTAYSASFRKYYVYQGAPADLPEALRPANPDDYMYIKWYVAGAHGGNQPVDLFFDDTTTSEYGCILLGSTGGPEGTVAASSGSHEGTSGGTTFTMTVAHGYDPTVKSAYIWCAYPIDAFPTPGERYEVTNTLTVRSVGADDGITSTKTTTATVPIVPPHTYTVTKSWDDEANARGYRPESTEVYVWRSGGDAYEEYKTLTLNEANDWTATFYDEDSRTWSYKVSEFKNRLVYGESMGLHNGVQVPMGRYTENGIQTEPRVYTAPELDEQRNEFWSYKFEGCDYDEATHTFTVRNRLYTRVPQTHRILKTWVGDEEHKEEIRPKSLKVWVAKDVAFTNGLGGLMRPADGHPQRSFWFGSYPRANTYYDEYGYLVSGTWREITLTPNAEGAYVGYFTDDDPYDHTYTVHEFSDLRDFIGRSLASGGYRTWQQINADGSKTVYTAHGWTYYENDRRWQRIDPSQDLEHAIDEYEIENRLSWPGVTSTTYPVIAWTPTVPASDVAKWSVDYTENYERSKHKEFYLSNVVNGAPQRNESDLHFRVAGTSYHEALTVEGEPSPLNRSKRSVTVEVTDDGLRLEGAELSAGDYRIKKITWQNTPVRLQERMQTDEWSPWYWTSTDYSREFANNGRFPAYRFKPNAAGHTVLANPGSYTDDYAGEDVSSLFFTAKVDGFVDGNWRTYAYLSRSNGWLNVSTLNGATLIGNGVLFPESDHVTQTRVAGTSKAQAMSVMYDVYPELLSSDAVREITQTKLQDSDYAVYDVCNTTTMRVLEADGSETEATDMYGNCISGKRADSHEYVHARNQCVGVTLDKTFATTENDKILQRVKVHTDVSMLQQSNIVDAREWREALEDGALPMAESGVWYDLVPAGMLVDVNSVTVGDGDVLRDVWVVENYRGTGRTLLCASVQFAPHEFCMGAQDEKPSSVAMLAATGDAWPNEGYATRQTLGFDAWYPWDAVREHGAEGVRNVAAFEADELQLGNLRGFSGQADDPRGPAHRLSEAAVTEPLLDLMTNLDEARDENAFVYAGDDLAVTVMDFRAQAGIFKQVAVVGSDQWGTGRDVSEHNAEEPDPAVNVYEDGAYMYRYTVRASSQTALKNMVIIDALENYSLTKAANAREIADAKAHGWTDGEGEQPEVTSWHGRLTSLDLTALREAGIDPVVWYSTTPGLDPASMGHVVKGDPGGSGSSGNDGAAGEGAGGGDGSHPAGGAVPGELVLDFDALENSGDWTCGEPEDWGEVTAFAVDCRHASDDAPAARRDAQGNFMLPPDEFVSFVSYLRAPKDASGYLADSDGDGSLDGRDPTLNAHAYNNVFLESTQIDPVGDETESYIHQDYTKVGIMSNEISVCKRWDDENDNDGKRPDSVVVRLVANGEPTDISARLSESNDWRHTFMHVPAVDENNQHIAYAFQEDDVDGYALTSVERVGDEVTYTNTHVPETLDLPIRKTWEGDEGTPSARPASVTFDLYADGASCDESKTLTAAGGWKATFAGLRKYDRGHPIEYTVRERTFAGGSYVSHAERDGGGINVTNTYHPFGDLLVCKQVVGATAACATHEFAMTFVFTDSNGMDVIDEFEYRTSDGRTGTVRTGQSVLLAADQSVVVWELPAGITYRVIEQNRPGYRGVATNEVGRIAPNTAQVVTYVNTYSTEGAYTPTLNKVLMGAQLRRGQFSFELLNNDDEVLRTAWIVPDASQTVEREDTEGGVERSGGYTRFGTLRFSGGDDGKTFVYRLREVDGGKDCYAYDKSTYTLTLRPHDTGQGRMDVDVTWRDEDGRELADGSVPTFCNSYEATGEVRLEAWKSLVGRDLRNGEFSFELCELDEDGRPTVIQTKTNDARGHIEWDPIAYTQDDIGKTFSYLAREVEGTDPTVRYDDASKGYEVLVVDNADGTLSCVQTNAEYRIEMGSTPNTPLVTCPMCNGSLVDAVYETSGDDLYIPMGGGIADGLNETETYSAIDYMGWYTYFHWNGDSNVNRISDASYVLNGMQNATTTSMTHGEQWYRLVNGLTAAGTEPNAIFAQIDAYDDWHPSSATASLLTGHRADWPSMPPTCYSDIYVTRTDSATKIKTTYRIHRCETCGGTGQINIEELTVKVETGDAPVPVFENTLVPGSLRIEKHIENGDGSAEFVFRVLLSHNGETEEREVTLHGGNSVTLPNIEAGTAYAVFEEAPAGWVLVDEENVTGVIEPLEVAEATFTNEYRPGVATANVLGFKTLDGGNAHVAGFEFELVGTGEDDDVRETCVTAADGVVSFGPFTYGEAGTHTYIVREVAGSDATIGYDEHEEEVRVDVDDDGAGNLLARVTYDEDGVTQPGSLVVRKVVEVVGTAGEPAPGSEDGSNGEGMPDASSGDGAGEDAMFAFAVRLRDALGRPLEESSTSIVVPDGAPQATCAEDGTYELVLRGGQEAQFQGIPAGSSYEVEEKGLVEGDDVANGVVRALPALGWRRRLAENTFGVIEPACTSVATFTNEYKTTGTATIIAKKCLTGRPLANGEFSFELLGEGGACVAEATNDEEGFVEFGPLSFDAPGTYHYTIREVPGDDEDLIYDERELAVTVEMTDDGRGVLAAEVAFANGDDTFQNAVRTTTLRVTKRVENATVANGDAEFSFDVELGDDSEANEQSEPALTLKADETGVIEDVPVGSAYCIVERAARGWKQVLATGEEGIVGAGGAEATFTNRYVATGSFVLETHKYLTGTPIEAGQFEFELRDELGNLLQTTTNDAGGRVAFDPIHITEADAGTTRTYFIYEAVGANAHTTYDERALRADVVIVDNGDGTLHADVLYGGNGFFNDWAIQMPNAGASALTSLGAAGGMAIALVSLRRKRKGGGNVTRPTMG